MELFLMVDILNKVNNLSAGEIVAGTVTTLSPTSDATAELTGEFPLQTLNLGIPRGVQGNPGQAGAPGPKGDKGDTGAAGTNGTNGAPGAKGDTGDTGPAGPKGDTGDTGPAGPAGPGTVETVNGDAGPDVVLTQDSVGDGTTYKRYSATDKTKLAGIASGATANDTDGNLKARANHTGTQAISTVIGLQTAIDGKQDVDADLTAIAGISPTNDDIIQRKAGAWINRTPTQFKSDLSLAKGDVGLGNVDNTSDANKPVSTAQQTALDLKANISSLAAVATSGSASDITTGTLPTSVLPPLAVNDVFVVASQAAMLALTAEKGDMAVRSDSGKTYVLSTNSPSTLADWKEVLAAGQVQSVNGQTGVVSLVKGDVGLGSVDNTSDTSKPVSTAQQTALDGKQNLDSDLTAIAGIAPSNDDIIQRKSGAWTNRTMSQLKTDLVLVKGDVGLGNVDNTSNATERAATATLTNKRITKRVSSTTDTATLTVASDDYDVALVTALAQAMTIASPSGTPTSAQSLIIRIKDNGTARALTWNSAFRAIGVTLPTTTVISKTVYVGCIWNAADSKWDVIAVAQEA